MKVSQAIKQADDLRDNTLSEEQKAAWLYNLDGEIAEIIAVDLPENVWPEDRELLMPSPHDELYVLYLAAQIDYYNREIKQYANDMAVFNEAFNAACAWWRRNNCPKAGRYWKVM